jgi:hypothetical protein
MGTAKNRQVVVSLAGSSHTFPIESCQIMPNQDADNSILQVQPPESVTRLIEAVQHGIRRNASLTGLLLTVLAGAIVFWLTTGLDSGWFALQKLELPVGLRAIMLATLLPAAVWLIASRVLYPWFRRIGTSDVAELLEQRFPAFQNRLMTSVNAARGYPNDGPAVNSMLQRTVTEAGDIASQLDAGDVFDRTQLKRRGTVAASLVASIAVFGLLSPDAIPRWWNAFVRCAPVYHQRSTQLDVVVIAQPGDRRVSFSRLNEDLVYLHPRSADLQLEMTIPAGGPSADRQWIVPDRVRVDVIRNDGSRSRSFVSAGGDRSFRLTLTRLQEDVRLEFLAGDFRTTAEYRVACVSTPEIDAVRLQCRYPEYTGWNSLRQTDVSILGSETTLPLFTRFDLVADCNKPLQSVRIVTDWFELIGDAETASVVARDGYSGQLISPAPLLSEDGRTIRLPLQVMAGPTDVTTDADPQPAIAEGSLPLASNTAVRFFLHDIDGVYSTTPEVLRIRGVPDEPPSITTSLTGVGNAVTRLARVPVTGTITDDYGIQTAQFQFHVDDESQWRPRPFRNSPPAGVTEFDLQRTEAEAFEVFDLQPLDLSEGQSLTLTVTATDSNDLTGPGQSRGEPIVLRVVTNEELLSLLYTREINLRRRFEEVITQLQQTQDDLVFHREFAARLDTGDAAVIRAEDSVAVNTCATRSSNNLRRQQNELLSIVEGFEEIIQQLVNNSVPPRQIADNMRTDILQPLQTAAAESIPEADRAVSAFRVATQQQQPSAELVTQAVDELTTLIRELKRILESVRDMAEFHEALRDLKSILEEQERLLDETRQMQKRNLIDKLRILD